VDNPGARNGRKKYEDLNIEDDYKNSRRNLRS
jgi:hypothetical protein